MEIELNESLNMIDQKSMHSIESRCKFYYKKFNIIKNTLSLINNNIDFDDIDLNLYVKNQVMANKKIKFL